jgi:hypothetical protein
MAEISVKHMDLHLCSVAHLTLQGKLFVELPEADTSSTILDENKRRNL